MKRNKKSRYDVNPLLLNRDSPKTMSGEKISKKELMPLFEAARWAPSSYNAQLWRFIYVLRESNLWQDYLSLLFPMNKEWARNAGVLVVVATRKHFEYNEKMSKTAQFDAGAACQNLSLEGFRKGLAIHLMEGFDYVKAAKLCSIPNNYKILAMIAIGKRTRVIEKKSSRRPLREIISEGVLKNNI
jgi:nitroreductase